MRTDPDPRLPRIVLPQETGDRGMPALLGWMEGRQEELLTTLRTVGGVLFRGFDVRGAPDHQRALSAIAPSLMNYAGGNSPRTKVADKIYTSTEYPADQRITMHNELSYANTWPTWLMFHCQIAPRVGGETPISDGRRTLELLPDLIVQEFERKGLTYLQTLHGGRGLGRSWQDTFETTDREAVERHLAGEGVEFEWSRGGALKVRYHRPALLVHPETKDQVWFCQADQWHPSQLDAQTRQAMESLFAPEELPHNVMFGDGSPIPDETLATIRELQWSSASVFPWQGCDLLLIDNRLIAHGRNAFSGPRRVFVAMA